MKTKSLPLICICVLIVILLISCESEDAQVVSEIPSGFTRLPEGGLKGNDLRYVTWESQISFLDADGICIYQTGFHNSDFILKYKDEYYVNEKKYSELVEIAAFSPEQRCHTYSLGDTIEIRGEGKSYYVSIISLERRKLSKNNPYATIDITFSAITHLDEIELNSIFATIETTDGVFYNGFEFINSRTARIEIRDEHKLAAIVLKSPEYPVISYRVVAEG